jgi:CBS domain-containing protein
MLVSHLMREECRARVSVAAGTSLSDVVQLLHQRRIGAALVLEADGTLAGVLSERDVVSALAKDGGTALGRSARDYATRDMSTCTESDEVEDIVNAMMSQGARYVPVVDKDRVVGVVSLGDVVKSLVSDSRDQANDLHEILRSLGVI